MKCGYEAIYENAAMKQLRDIEYFSVVAEHGHLGRAADALGLSQPALSKSLRRLEQAMQAKLVRRTSKGMALTSVGAALLSRVRQLRLSLEDVTREMADLAQGHAGNLRIGCAPLFCEPLAPRSVHGIPQREPKGDFESHLPRARDSATGLAPWRAGPSPCPPSNLARRGPGAGAFV
jgi:DNA-binding transcriptional LysR family regulator